MFLSDTQEVKLQLPCSQFQVQRLYQLQTMGTTKFELTHTLPTDHVIDRIEKSTPIVQRHYTCLLHCL
jgi:hypothetical protein